jgi:hypothetical protein
MNDYFARFSASPASFKKSFSMLAVAWICHPIFIYLFFLYNQAVEEAGAIILRMVAVVFCLGILLFLIKKWARALVVVGNCLIVVYDIFVLAVSPPHTFLSLLCVSVVLFTIVGTYWLFVKDSRDYFTRVNPKQNLQNLLTLSPGPHVPVRITKRNYFKRWCLSPGHLHRHISRYARRMKSR